MRKAVSVVLDFLFPFYENSWSLQERQEKTNTERVYQEKKGWTQRIIDILAKVLEVEASRFTIIDKPALGVPVLGIRFDGKPLNKKMKKLMANIVWGEQMRKSGIEEKRAHQRHKIKVSVSLSNNNRLVRSSDLSLGGIFIETYAPPNVGDSIVFNLGAAFNGAIRLETSTLIQATVRWLRTDENGEYCGFGASFVDLDEAQKAFVEKVIKKSETESLMDFAELETE